MNVISVADVIAAEFVGFLLFSHMLESGVVAVRAGRWHVVKMANIRLMRLLRRFCGKLANN